MICAWDNLRVLRKQRQHYSTSKVLEEKMKVKVLKEYLIYPDVQ